MGDRLGLQNKLSSINEQKTNYLLPENIKNGISILGVTGTYTGSGGSLEPGQAILYKYTNEWELNNAVTTHTITPSVGDWAVICNDVNDITSMTSICIFNKIGFTSQMMLHFEDTTMPMISLTVNGYTYNVNTHSRGEQNINIIFNANETEATISLYQMSGSSIVHSLIARYMCENPMEVTEYGEGSYSIQSLEKDGETIEYSGYPEDENLIDLSVWVDVTNLEIGETIWSNTMVQGNTKFFQGVYIFTEKGTFSQVVYDNKYVQLK